ncbi:MAG: YXWGXW repeat-containing protein [Alphaproteobacteria bacterium]|nr:YXWGXW repeat-containing protein [Alphaproteobacteria bacterium]
MLDRRKMLATVIVAMSCSISRVSAQPPPVRPPMPPPRREVRPLPPPGPRRWHWTSGRWRWNGRRWVWVSGRWR